MSGVCKPISDQNTTSVLCPRLVGVKDACRLLGIGKSRLYELAAANRLKKVRLDGRALITMESIDQLVDELLKEVSHS